MLRACFLVRQGGTEAGRLRTWSLSASWTVPVSVGGTGLSRQRARRTLPRRLIVGGNW